MMQRVSNQTRGSVISMIALALIVLAVDVIATPSARRNPGMVWSPEAGGIILFGGLSPVDAAALRYEFGDTWKFTGTRWVRLYPSNAPSPRYAASMVYDSNRDRIVLFGGAAGETYLADTWVYEDGNWKMLDTPQAPPARRFGGIAFDAVRDRIVLFGGGTGDGRFFDTWEFDGTTWTLIQSDGPQAEVPSLVWDAARGETLMLGSVSGEPSMYRYDGANWTPITPENMPPCVLQSQMVFRPQDGSVLQYGGSCFPVGVSNDTWIWDGDDWSELTLERTAGSLFGYGLAHDSSRNHTVLYGGTGFSENGSTFRLSGSRWVAYGTSYEPGPRTQFILQPDPSGENDGLLLFAGQDAIGFFSDLWTLDQLRWNRVSPDGLPAGCTSPAAAIDPVRERLVVLCSDSDTYEYDGTAWEEKTSNSSPTPRRFSMMEWDPASRRVIMYGGIDNFGSYLNETWAWTGSAWTKLDLKRDQRPNARMLSTMFVDPQTDRIIIAGGIGRPDFNSDFQRYEDQWQFDGSKWVTMNPSTKLPQRYGSQVALDPVNDRVLVFGGKNNQEQYLNDLWQWNGSTWSEVEDGAAPAPRMNGRMAWDPSTGKIVLYGGYAGVYYSELWTFDGAWQRVEVEYGRNRRISRPGTGTESDSGSVVFVPPSEDPPAASPKPSPYEELR